jgi:hypothetical protein
MSGREITFLKAFNAKEMPDSEVAKSFVSSEKFSALAGAWNALILGPRGSGKTTLLKMLRLPALRMWGGRDADLYRAGIDFTGVFVPADVIWSEMAEALGRKRLSADVQESVVQSLFCVNVLLALVEAFEARINPTIGAIASNYRCAEHDGARLTEALRTICSHWELQPRITSLLGIKTALQSRLLMIQSEITKLTKKNSPTLEAIEIALPFLYLPAVTAVEVAVEQFDTAIGDVNGKWALLFDEFEIAPAEMQNLVFRRFRSAGKKVFYKVGLAPCTAHTMASLATVSEATSGNDYRHIELWYPEKKSALKFSTQLFQSIYSNGTAEPKDPGQIFGANHFVVEDEDDIELEAQPYGKGEQWKIVFESLERKDALFRKFLEKKEIKTSNLDTSPHTPTGNTIRKIAPLVAFRDAFRREGLNAPKRGRKKLNFAYSGWEAVSAICEGNPRWLIGVIGMMTAAEPLSSFTIKPSTQVDKINEATDSFSAMLSLVPLASRGIKTNEQIDKLLRQIGDYFFARLVNDDFVEEPPLSFRVDEKVSGDIQAAVRIAINHGALINIPDAKEEQKGFDDLIGKRFRLAYLLSPRFKLPLRATKAVSLSTILTHAKTVANAHIIIPTSNQMNLL